MSMLVIGCGYSGARVAARHAARGGEVTGTHRQPHDAVDAGIRMIAFDADAPSALPLAAIACYTAPPPDSGVTDSRLAATLAVLPPPEVFVYLGTTGVYGDCGGALVDEDAPLRPDTDRARRRADAEARVQAWCGEHGVVPVILRVSAIYGPGRLPLERLRAGQPSPDGSGPGNRIHVDDLAQAALAVADFATATGRGGTWNVSDGNPLPVADFNDLVADIAGLPRPRRVPLDSPEITPGQRSFLAESRRVDNRRLLGVPGFHLRYPDPADGIRASVVSRTRSGNNSRGNGNGEST